MGQNTLSYNHFCRTFPSLSKRFVVDEQIFTELAQMLKPAIEFLNTRGMDQKDGVYTRIITTIRERAQVIFRNAKVTTSNEQILNLELDMMIDYFAWAFIHGEDTVDALEVSNEQKIYTYDWGSLIADVLQSHLAIQSEIEKIKPSEKAAFDAIGEERAKLLGWDSLSQKEYYSNLDQYEDLTFQVQLAEAKQNPAKPIEGF